MFNFFSGCEFLQCFSFCLDFGGFLSVVSGMTGLVFLFYLDSKKFCFFSILSASTKKFLLELTKKTQTNKMKGLNVFFIIMFLILLTLNLSGLFPLVYSKTSKIFFVLFLGVWFCISLAFSGLLYNFFYMVGSLCMKSSLMLSPCLFFIELVSLFLRPLTLSLRLTMKMLTGHIVLSLISGFVVSFFFQLGMFCTFILLMLYCVFELFVCFVQSTVFVLLCVSYTLDHKN